MNKTTNNTDSASDLSAASGSALKYLQKDEWTMGNGQCHVCCGKQPRRGWWTDTVGHRKDCELAKNIEGLGGKIVWERKNHSRKVKQTNDFFRGIFEKYN